MLRDGPRLESVELKSPGSGNGEMWCVTFSARAETEFEIPVWLGRNTPDADLVVQARAKLHRLLSDLAAAAATQS